MCWEHICSWSDSVSPFKQESPRSTDVSHEDFLVHNHIMIMYEEDLVMKQECIPVGCLPSTAVAVCWGVCLEGQCMLRGVSARRCLPKGVSAQGVSSQGVSAQGGGVSARGVAPRHPNPLWTEWQTPVKTLPCRNYVADGNNRFYPRLYSYNSICVWAQPCMQ